MLDTVGISLSALCVLHCIALPLLLVAVPVAREILNEWVHVALLLAVVPVAGWALVSGARRHGVWRWAFVGAVGVILLLAAHPIAHAVNVDAVATVATMTGAITLAVAHLFNHRGCRTAAA